MLRHERAPYVCATCKSLLPSHWVRQGIAIQEGTKTWCSKKCHEARHEAEAERQNQIFLVEKRVIQSRRSRMIL